MLCNFGEILADCPAIIICKVFSAAKLGLFSLFVVVDVSALIVSTFHKQNFRLEKNNSYINFG